MPIGFSKGGYRLARFSPLHLPLLPCSFPVSTGFSENDMIHPNARAYVELKRGSLISAEDLPIFCSGFC